MAVTATIVGPQSPLNRNVERLLEEAQISGELRISSRRLREFPKVASKYTLSDCTYGDLSKNKLSELPTEVTRFSSLEKLNLYHNVIRFIPETVMYLQCLTYLDISRNQLSVIPAHLCKLPLQVLLVSHNRLVSLPEEINQLTELIELDASCNQLSHLPIQLGDLQHLEALNLRKNFLVELPRELMFLKLVTLDISLNRISVLPVELRFMVSLVDLCVEHNPLTSPPVHLCTRGRIHIFKYLEMEAIKEDRKRGILEGGDCRRMLPRKPSTLPDARFSAYDPRRKRYTVHDNSSSSNSGYNGNIVNNTAMAPAASPQPPPPPPPPPPASVVSNSSSVVDGGPDIRWPVSNSHHSNGHTPSAEIAPPAFSPLNPPAQTQSFQLDDEEDEDKEGNEERRRAARKILEHQMGTSEEQRSPGQVQTYRDYMEAKTQRLQRGNVYKVRDGSSHTPSPDTPPEFGRPFVTHHHQQFSPNHTTSTATPSPVDSHSNHSQMLPPPVPVSIIPSPKDFSRPLTLNLSHDEANNSNGNSTANKPPSNVKMVQKEAVLSYIKAKTSPSSTAAPPAFRSPLTEQLLSPTLPYRPLATPPSPLPGRTIATPTYRAHPPDQSVVGIAKKLTTPPGGGGVSQPIAPGGTLRLNRQNLHKTPPIVNGKVGTNGNNHANHNHVNQTTPPTGHHTLSNHTAATASFTVRREMERQREEMEQIQQLRQCIEQRLKVTLPEDLGSALMDGVVLCHLANHVRPRSVASIHVPSPAVPKLPVARCRRNVENFIQACRMIGVPENELCTWMDVAPLSEDENAPPKNTTQLVATIKALLDPATWIKPQDDDQQELTTNLPDSPGPCSPFRPLSPPPTPTQDVPLSVDVNENDQLPTMMMSTTANPLTKCKRVTFAPEVIDLAEETQEVVANFESEQPEQSDTTAVALGRVSMTEMVVSHCALALVMLVATVIYNWSLIAQ